MPKAFPQSQFVSSFKTSFTCAFTLQISVSLFPLPTLSLAVLSVLACLHVFSVCLCVCVCVCLRAAVSLSVGATIVLDFGKSLDFILLV